MPIAQVEMDDGKLYEIEFEGSQPPSEQEIISYIGGQQQPQQYQQEVQQNQQPLSDTRKKVSMGLEAAQFVGGFAPAFLSTPITGATEFAQQLVEGKSVGTSAKAAGAAMATDAALTAAFIGFSPAKQVAKLGAKAMIKAAGKEIGEQTTKTITGDVVKELSESLWKKQVKETAKEAVEPSNFYKVVAEANSVETNAAKEIYRNPKLLEGTVDVTKVADNFKSKLDTFKKAIGEKYTELEAKLNVPSGQIIDTSKSREILKKERLNPERIVSFIRAERNKVGIDLTDDAIDNFVKGNPLTFQEAKDINALLAQRARRTDIDAGRLLQVKKALLNSMEQTVPQSKRLASSYADRIGRIETIKNMFFKTLDDGSIQPIESVFNAASKNLLGATKTSGNVFAKYANMIDKIVPQGDSVVRQMKDNATVDILAKAQEKSKPWVAKLIQLASGGGAFLLASRFGADPGTATTGAALGIGLGALTNPKSALKTAIKTTRAAQKAMPIAYKAAKQAISSGVGQAQGIQSLYDNQ